MHEADLNDGGVWVSPTPSASFARAQQAGRPARRRGGQHTCRPAPASTSSRTARPSPALGTASGQLVPIDPRTLAPRAIPGRRPGHRAPKPRPSPHPRRPARRHHRDGRPARAARSGRSGSTRAPASPAWTACRQQPSRSPQVGKRRGRLAVDVHGTCACRVGRRRARSPSLHGAPAPSSAAGRPSRHRRCRPRPPTSRRSATTGWSTTPRGPGVSPSVSTSRQRFGASVTDAGWPRYAALQYPGPDADDVARRRPPTRCTLVPPRRRPQPGRRSPCSERVAGCPAAAGLPTGAPRRLPARCLGRLRPRSSTARTAGAPGDVPTATLEREGAACARDGVTLRVNRGLVVLNDLDSGDVWDLDSKPVKIDNWDVADPAAADRRQERRRRTRTSSTRRQPRPAAQGRARQPRGAARPHRRRCTCSTTTPTRRARSSPSARPTSPSPTSQGVAASVSADGQTVDVSVPEQTPGASRSRSATRSTTARSTEQVGEAKVTRAASSAELGQHPAEPAAGAAPSWPRPRTPSSPASSCPVRCHRRLARPPRTTPSPSRPPTEGSVGRRPGPLTVLAPQKVGKQAGRRTPSATAAAARPRARSASQVLEHDDSKFVAPRHPAGRRPRRRRQAAADPAARQRHRRRRPDRAGCRMRLRSRGAPGRARSTSTPTSTPGVVTVTGSAPGTYELTYARAGRAPGSAPGRIRVDLVAPDPEAPRRSRCPTRRPCAARRRSSPTCWPTTTARAATCSSPAASSVDGDGAWLRPSIYQGRWVRIEAREPATTGAGPRAGTVEVHRQRRHQDRRRARSTCRSSRPPEGALPDRAGRRRRRCGPATAVTIPVARQRHDGRAASRSSSTRHASRCYTGDGQRASPPATSSATCPRRAALEGRAGRHPRVRRLPRRDADRAQTGAGHA